MIFNYINDEDYEYKWDWEQINKAYLLYKADYLKVSFIRAHLINSVNLLVQTKFITTLPFFAAYTH